MYISKSETSKTKICNFACSYPARANISLRFALYGFWDFQGHVTYWGSCDIKFQISKICKFASNYPARVESSLCFAPSLTVSEITANLHFWGHVTYLGSCDIKSKIWKFACSKPARVENWLRFALSLTVSEMTANLHFRGHVTLRVMWRKIENFSWSVS